MFIQTKYLYLTHCIKIKKTYYLLAYKLVSTNSKSNQGSNCSQESTLLLLDTIILADLFCLFV